MIEHSFNVEIAKLVGVNAAILFNNISYWCEKNKANNKHYYDDQFWTYNSLKAFVELFPYLSIKQIKTSLDKLEQFGFIGYGEYNTNPYDRTRWYCDLTQKVGLNLFLSNIPKGEMESTKRKNVEDTKRVSSITDIKTDVNTDSKHLNIINEQSSFGNNEISFEDVPLPKKNEMTLYQKFVEIWLKEFKIGWKFTATDGRKMKSMIENVKRSLKNHRTEFTEEECTSLFRHFLQKLPDFYKNQSLSVLETKYDSIIEEIKNGKQRNNTSARVDESINFFRNLQ